MSFLLCFSFCFGSTGIPSDIKLCLTAGSTNWNDFSSRTTITSAENPDFEIWLELNSPYEFSSAYSAKKGADSLHRKLLSYRQNRNDAKIYSGARSSCYFNNHPPFPPPLFFFFFFCLLARRSALFHVVRARVCHQALELILTNFLTVFSLVYPEEGSIA